MKKHALYIITLAVLALVAAGCTTTNAPIPSGQGIKLVADETGQYTPKEIRVSLGSTVRLEGDPVTLVGGMDTIIVDGYEVSKKVAPNDNVLEFVADKPGEFSVHCANGMGNAQLIVE